MRRFSLVSKDAELLELASHASSLTASQNAWITVVPKPLAAFTKAGSIKHKRLTVYADNGAVAARLKLMLPSLLGGLQKQGLEVTAIRVEVQVQSTPRRRPARHRQLSPAAAASLGKLANSLEGSPLGEALQRLASRTGQQ